ncbi:uncharacterized protein PAC_19786 [Phialocephala subalpina]|uniref:Uncharacterized protein n=1 Tax=Phialocephala subalpina TaxID=576137 RepID=A0A1L7XY39_9HELO|nr:uncharacterized protein PAC_19786 [Phialocephala subalpina]
MTNITFHASSSNSTYTAGHQLLRWLRSANLRPSRGKDAAPANSAVLNATKQSLAASGAQSLAEHVMDTHPACRLHLMTAVSGSALWQREHLLSRLHLTFKDIALLISFARRLKEPIVTQAGIALGSLHDVLTVVDVEPGSRALSTSFPSLEYIQALGDLRNYLSSSATIDVNVVLIYSLHLIRASSEIASGSSGPSSPHRQEIDSELIDAFQSLDIHASSFQGMRPPAMTRFHTSDIPGRFSSLKESHLALSGILVKLSSFNRSVVEEYKYRKLQDLPLEAFAETTSITADFDAWDDRFQKFLHRSTSKFSRADQIIIDILIINHHLGFIEAATCTHTQATIFDQFDAPFDEIVTLAANVIRTRKTSKILDFHLDIGVIQPLYWTTVKCREPWTRQKAMSLLKSINFQEGVWIAAAQVSIAQVAIDRENAFNDSTILSDRPMEFARVHSVGTVIDPVKKTAEVVLSQKLNGLDGPWHEHVGWCSWG